MRNTGNLSISSDSPLNRGVTKTIMITTADIKKIIPIIEKITLKKVPMTFLNPLWIFFVFSLLVLLFFFVSLFSFISKIV